MKKIIFLALFLCIGLTLTHAQRNCGSHDHMLEQMQEDPAFEQRMQEIEKQTRSFLQSPDKNNGVIITIPVVVHVVYKANSQNISTSQIQSQIDVLNEDFRRMNSDANGTWPQAADTEIEFCLATVDPSGNSTTGIQRRKTNKRSFGSNDAMKANNTGGINAWPASDYLNIWVCNLSGGLLGYAQFPGGPASTDGVVVDYAYFGNTGTATAPFDLGRTATHEVGHWLNLRHIWGDGGCSVDDFVSDTPLSDASNGGCATGHVSCGSVDMVENYMDYSDDACMNLFTSGQSNRMNALFSAGGARASLLSSGGCGGGNSGPTCSDGVMNGNETGIDCGGPDCSPCGATCSDGIMNGNETGIDCGGPDCSACAPTCSDGVMNGNETGVDCGGPDCSPCSGGGTCDTPSGLVATNIKPKKARLNWNSVSSATSYNLQVAVAGTTNWTTFTTTGTNKTVNGLSNGTSYDWRVESVCGSSTSGYSGVCNFTAGNSNSGDCAARLNLSEFTDFSVYPNPASQMVSITNLDPTTVSKVDVIDISGKLINSITPVQAMQGIPLDNFNPGVFIIKVNYNDESFSVKRFIKVD